MNKLHENDTLEIVINWLVENLKDNNSFTPHKYTIPDVTSKGIYFWFMHPDGYKQFSDFVEITPIVPVYKRIIDSIEYDLVYLGTAGTGKNGGSNLQKRFEWHIIKPHHTPSNICHGTLSTLRAGLGSLLSDDLILPNTEKLVNEFMTKYMKLYWIEYPDNKELIDNDEIILIKRIKPLFNLDYNPNANIDAIHNPTRIYKIRRNEINNSTKLRLDCNNNNNSKKAEKKNPKPKIPVLSNKSDNCITFNVSVNQSIHEVINQINNLPVPCTFICRNAVDVNQPVYPSNNNLGWRTTGNIGNQNIYTYFTAPDINYTNNHNYQSNIRWRFIQEEMRLNGIDNITVNVCPL